MNTRRKALARRDAPAEEIETCSAMAWPPEPRERGDFYHRVRVFPPEIREWREALAARIGADRKLFPRVRPGEERERLRAFADDGITFLREISRVLEVIYGSPSLGNKADPLDELVYIMLSRKTREDAYVRGFDALKKAYDCWDDLLDSTERTVARIVGAGGLGKKKTRSLFGALGAIRARFGRCTLAPLRKWTDGDVEDFLCSLPEVSRKSAYCIMMYSLGRRVFPVDTHVGRVLSRLGPFREAGLDLSGLDHKKLQAVLAELVPPNLRHALHVNLVMHGREVCRAVRPLCDSCEIRRFCAFYRRRSAERAHASDFPTVVDVFSGAGGLSQGFARAGFRLVAAIDSDPVALRTLALNHPELPEGAAIARDVREVRPRELRSLLGRRGLDVLVGAPPCQGFSMAGFRSKVTRTGYRLAGDERNFLSEYLVDLAVALRPKLFLMENVPGMKTARKDDTSFLESTARLLQRRGGYRTAIWELNAASIGVAQDRTRCFLVGSRTGSIPLPPEAEYQDSRRRGFDVDALPPVTLDEALIGLPPRHAGQGTSVEPWPDSDTVKQDPRSRRYLAKFKLTGSSRVVYNHFARYQNPRDLELYALLRPGEDSVHAIERHGRADLMRYRVDVFDDKYARLRGDRPSKTIVSHLAKDGNGYIHPREVRSITVREAARVQSFPDDYVFCGSPSDQWIQVGNAVPPLLSEAIGRSFLRVLRGGARR